MYFGGIIRLSCMVYDGFGDLFAGVLMVLPLVLGIFLHGVFNVFVNAFGILRP